jgi:hypothetical protein
MMIDITRLREIVASDNHVTAATVVLIADHLVTWWRATRHLHASGEVVGGKVSPWVRIKRDAAAVLWDRRARYVLDRAIKYLEENHGVAKRDGEEASGGGGSPPVESDPPDLCTGGVEEAVDRGAAVVRGDLGTVPRKGRKPGVSKLPAHLRP